MKCDNLFVYSGLFMLIYTRVFFSVGVVVGWLVGLVESFFLSYLFICCFKIKYAYIEFSLMSGQCVWFMNAAHTIFFFGCKPDTLSAWLIHLALSHLQNCGCEWIWSLYLILKPHNQCNVYSGTGHILCSW